MSPKNCSYVEMAYKESRNRRDTFSYSVSLLSSILRYDARDLGSNVSLPSPSREFK
jgi:hypothetical protein